MLEPITTFTDSIMGNLIGGSGSTAVWTASLLVIMVLVAVLLTARLGFDIAMIIIAPGIVIASFAGLLPMLSFGIIVILLAVFWAGIIMALSR